MQKLARASRRVARVIPRSRRRANNACAAACQKTATPRLRCFRKRFRRPSYVTRSAALYHREPRGSLVNRGIPRSISLKLSPNCQIGRSSLRSYAPIGDCRKAKLLDTRMWIRGEIHCTSVVFGSSIVESLQVPMLSRNCYVSCSTKETERGDLI